MCCKRARPRTGRPTSLIRDIRDRASGGNQINEASHHQGTTPRDRTRRHPPDQPGWSCNPRPPVRSTPEVPYMSQQRDGVADLFVGYGLGAAELDFGVGTDRGQLRLAAHPPALPGRFCPTDPRRELPDDVRPPTPQRHNRPGSRRCRDRRPHRLTHPGLGRRRGWRRRPLLERPPTSGRARDQPIGPAPQPPQCRGLRSTVQTTSDFDTEYASAMTTSSRNPSLNLTARTLSWDG